MFTRSFAIVCLSILSLSLLSFPVTSSAANSPSIHSAKPSKTLQGSIIYYSSASMKTSLINLQTGAEDAIGVTGRHMVISPNRKMIAYVDERDQLHICYLETKNDVMLTDPSTRDSYASPTFVSNDTIAYIREDRNYETAIYLTPIGRFVERLWSGKVPNRTGKDSSTLRWIPGTNTDEPSFLLSNVYNIFVLTPQQNTALVQVDRSSGIALRDLALSPDGKNVAYMREEKGCNIWTIGIDGTNARRLTKVESGWPIWSPDGGYIAFLTTANVERGLTKQDIYNSSHITQNAGFFIYNIVIIRKDGTFVKSLKHPNGKPARTRGDILVWK